MDDQTHIHILNKVGAFGIYQKLLCGIFIFYTTFICGVNYYTEVSESSVNIQFQT